MWGGALLAAVAAAITAATPGPSAAPPTSVELTRALSIGGKLHEDGEPYGAWLEKLRTCTPAEVAAAKDSLPRSLAALIKSKKTVAIQGRLVPDRVECTLMGCRPGPCCNACSFDWVLVPRRDCPGRKLRIRQPADYLPLRGGGMDCAVYRSTGPNARVIVAGRVAGEDLLVQAELCRLGNDGDGTDRLDAADYARLMSRDPARKPAAEAPCGPTAKPPEPPSKENPTRPAANPEPGPRDLF